MGEDETIDFESLKQTLVFWNMDDYPIPVDTTDDLGPVFGDISKALYLMGFRLGFMDVRLYSEQHNYDKKSADIIRPSLPTCRSYSGCVYKVPDITLHMIRHASYLGPGPVNFFVIAKPQRELLRVLQCLKLRRHNVLLVKPPPPDEECLFSVDSLLNYARLLGGGKPRYNPLQGYMDEFDSSLEKYIEIKEDLSKTVDFSERIPTVKGPRTAVFWDAVDCPFPPSSTPDEIYHSISSALVEREFSDNITIWAYLDDDADKKGSWLGGDKTWASRIYFLPGGDNASRRIRMINDINLWMRDSPKMTTSYEASLVLFSDQFKDDDVYYRDMLQRLGNMRYYVLLVTPALDINKPETPEWPGLLIDRGAYFFDEVEIQIYQGPDAAAAEEETPPIVSDMDYSLLCPFGDQTSDSSEDEDSPFWPPRTDDMLIDAGQSSAEQESPVYRWDPFTLMYKLESLFPKEEHEAEEDTPDKLKRPGWQIDGGTSWESSKKPSPKKHKADAAEKGTPKRLPLSPLESNTLLRPKNKLKIPEWPGWQIHGGPGCESSEEPCPKEHKEYGNRKLVMSVLTRFDALRRRLCQLREAVSGIKTPAHVKAGSTCMSRGVITNTMKRQGIVPGVEIGDIFFFRLEMGLVGLHSQSMAGIDYVAVKGETTIATSIVSSGYYDKDEGNPDVLVYTAQGGGNADKENQTSDQKKRGNLALEKSLAMHSPVRVIRGFKEASQSAKIYIYDGLYEVKASWVEKEKSGHNNTFKYKLVRAPGQTPAFATWTAIKKWKAGLPSREGLILTDLTSGVESIGVSLVNNVDDENGPAYFTYSKTVTYSEPFKLTQPSLGCDCSSSCKPGNLNCDCVRKNGGDYPYCVNRVLVSRKPMIYECSPSCPCLVCQNKVTQMGIKLRLEVFKTENRGWGLRSWDPIRAGSFICIYAGEAKDKSKVEQTVDYDDYSFDTTRVYKVFKWNYEHGLADEVASEEMSEEPEMPLPLIISAKDTGNVARFMNNSCSPNVFWQPVSYENKGQLFLHVAFFAISHIPPMTELTYDYGVTQPSEAQDGNALHGMKKCFCGSEDCRGSFG